MRCPACGKDNDKVIDSRSRNEGRVIRRRRCCLSCNHRFSTVEEIEDKTLYVIKADGSRQQFDRQKILRGIQTACSKRPVSIETIETLVDELETSFINSFVREIKSREIGEMISARLRKIDEVAYVRFASVYRKFKDKEEFLDELKDLT